MKNEAETKHNVHQRLARHLDWNLLRTFIAVVECGGFSNAAETVHLTQPAISHAIKRLESSLELKLIERNARHFSVTESGRIVYSKAVEIHSHISRLADLSSPEKEKIYGHVRLMFASRLRSPLLDRLLQSFHTAHPEVTISIDVLPSIEIRQRIERGWGTIGLCLLRDEPTVIKALPIIKQNYGAYCGRTHKLFKRSAVTKDDLRDEGFITFPSDQMGGVLSPLMIFREQHHYRGQVIATSNNLDEIVRMTEIGIGVGLIPKHIAADLVTEHRLRMLPPLEGISPIDVHLIWNPKINKTKAEEVLIDFIQNALRQEAPDEPM